MIADVKSSLKTRVIPCLFLKNGLIVRSEDFKHHQVIGDPVTQLGRYNQWMADELVYIDISSGDDVVYDVKRNDAKIATHGKKSVLDIISEISKACFIPLTFGGRIRTTQDIRALLESGADKVTINTKALEDPNFINESARLFGSQCIIVSMDVKKEKGDYYVFSRHGKKNTGRTAAQWAKEAQERGAGEIFLNNIDRDGKAGGYDLDLVRQVSNSVSIPVIVCGGVGNFEHLAEGVKAGASAVAAANIFHFTEMSYKNAKKHLLEQSINVRYPYAAAKENTMNQKPVSFQKGISKKAASAAMTAVSSGPVHYPKVSYCRNCVYPQIAVFVTIGDDGLCSGCRVNLVKDEIDWQKREKMLVEILEKYRSKNNQYDCLIPVSGGKDSYYQIYMMKEVYKLNPLLVTYHGNNYTPEGMHNLENMRNVFGCDHIFFTPSIQSLIKMNRAGMKIQGDMNWHAHCGIYTYPVQIAVKYGIKLVIWGEHGPTHIGGQHSLDDFVEFNARARLEHNLRGYDWYDFVGFEGLTAADLQWAQYPSDEEIDAVGVRQIHLGNFVKWDENIHGKLMIEKYGFKPAEREFERTYRRMSNLDDMHENGAHDYLKFIKFGYGRGTDHASKDVRAGHMTRDKAIEMVRKYDHVKPMRDLRRWFDYVGMSEAEFDHIADTFRDPRVWWIKDGQWFKDNIWGPPSSYGPVHLDAEEQQKYLRSKT